MERWMREKKVENTDRAAHELRVLTDAFYIMGSVDQLNIGGLVSAEILCRRIATIVDAYASPGKPSWERARYFAGTGAAEEVISPGLRSYVAKKYKDDVDTMTARSRGHFRGAPTDGADGDGGAGGDDANAGGNKGGGRGRGRGKGGADGTRAPVPP